MSAWAVCSPCQQLRVQGPLRGRGQAALDGTGCLDCPATRCLRGLNGLVDCMRSLCTKQPPALPGLSGLPGLQVPAECR